MKNFITILTTFMFVTAGMADMQSDIEDGIARYDSLLKSGQIEFEIQLWEGDKVVDSEVSPDLSWDAEFYFSDAMMHYLVTERPDDQKYHLYYSGVKVTDIKETPHRSIMWNSDDLSKSRYTLPFDPRSWGWNVGGHEELRTTLDKLEIKWLKTANLNGEFVFLIEAVAPSDQSTPFPPDAEVKMWIHRRKSFRLQRVEVSWQSSDATAYQLVREFKLKQFAPDIWFPESATQVVKEVSSGKKMRFLSVQMDKVSLNLSIPKGRFDLQLPKGRLDLAIPIRPLTPFLTPEGERAK